MPSIGICDCSTWFKRSNSYIIWIWWGMIGFNTDLKSHVEVSITFASRSSQPNGWTSFIILLQKISSLGLKRFNWSAVAFRIVTMIHYRSRGHSNAHFHYVSQKMNCRLALLTSSNYICLHPACFAKLFFWNNEEERQETENLTYRVPIYCHVYLRQAYILWTVYYWNHGLWCSIFYISSYRTLIYYNNTEYCYSDADIFFSLQRNVLNEVGRCTSGNMYHILIANKAECISKGTIWTK